MQDLHTLIRACDRCRLRTTCNQVVPGEGPKSARVVFLAEAPGEDEDKLGRPLIGRTGQLFRDALRRAGIKESDVYISNMCRCRPPNNREPNPDEIEACWPWTLKTLQEISPRVIVPIGAPSTLTLALKFGFQKDLGQTKITKLAGVPVFVEHRNFYVFPVFHPSFAIRQTERRNEFFAHFKYLGVAIPGWIGKPE